MGRSSDGVGTANALDLHLNLSACNQAVLSFWIRDNRDATNPQDGIWFSVVVW